jgi:hypothetical protein
MPDQMVPSAHEVVAHPIWVVAFHTICLNKRTSAEIKIASEKTRRTWVKCPVASE